MKKYCLTYLAMSLGTFITVSGISLQDSIARDIKTADGIGRGNFSVVSDRNCYQILYEEYGDGYKRYYETVRERIIQKLKRNRKKYFNKGRVNIFFSLDSNGVLNKIMVNNGDSTDDAALINIVTLSLQQASPFPPFPEGLNAAQLFFNVTISFKDAS